MTLQAERSSTTVRHPAQGLIDGRWVDGDGAPYEVVNPVTEVVIAEVGALSVAQVDAAVAAAARTFHDGSWRDVPARERGAMLHRLADLIDRDRQYLIDLMVDEIGTPAAVATYGQLPMPIANLRWFGDAAIGGASGTDAALFATAASPGSATKITASRSASSPG